MGFNCIADLHKCIQKVCQHLGKRGAICTVEGSYDNNDVVLFNIHFPDDGGVLFVEFPIDVLKSCNDSQIIEYLKDRCKHNYSVVESNITTNSLH